MSDYCDYYIKYVWGPHAQEGYPDKNLIHFAKGQEGACQRFKKCKGFLLYETGSKEGGKTGLKTIYAQGIISSNQPKSIKKEQSRGREFPYAVKVVLQKQINPKNGISLEKMRKITGATNIQQKGGLLKITADQYRELSQLLN